MKEILIFLLVSFSFITSSFSQSDSTVRGKNNLNILPSLRYVVYSGNLDNEYFSLQIDLESLNLFNYSLQNIKDGNLTISSSNLKKKNFFDYKDFRNTPADRLKNMMPDFDLNSSPLPSKPLF